MASPETNISGYTMDRSSSTTDRRSSTMKRESFSELNTSSRSGSGSGSPEAYKNRHPYGLIKGVPKPRQQRIKWTAENDNKLLLIGLGKELIGKDYTDIAKWLPEKPTAKAVMERFAKLRKKQMEMLEEMGMAQPETELPDFSGGEEDGVVESIEGRTEPGSEGSRKRMSGGGGSAGRIKQSALDMLALAATQAATLAAERDGVKEEE